MKQQLLKFAFRKGAILLFKLYNKDARWTFPLFSIILQEKTSYKYFSRRFDSIKISHLSKKMKGYLYSATEIITKELPCAQVLQFLK